MTLSCFKRAMKKHNKELWLLGGFSVKEAKCEVNKWVVIPRKSTTSLDKNTKSLSNLKQTLPQFSKQMKEGIYLVWKLFLLYHLCILFKRGKKKPNYFRSSFYHVYKKGDDNAFKETLRG